MPRGIPNAKRDDNGVKYTAFAVPLQPNPKHVGSSYLKTDAQTIWSRPKQNTGPAPPASAKRGEYVLVIHPGSRYLRIGRASDFKPVSVSNVVARKLRSTVSPVPPLRRIAAANFDESLDAMSVSLVDRMRFYKFRSVPRSQATNTCLAFNEKASPEIIPEHNDPYRVNWVQSSDADLLVGDEALRLPDPQKMGYLVRWPIYGTDFNTRQYSSTQVILSDIQAVILHALSDPSLNIPPKDHSLYSVILVVPDLYSRGYINSMVNLLLSTLGFKQACVQQESLAATYGAGMSTSLVVDIGATTTSIACVDEGLVVADTRVSLSVGGDDITECLGVLLNKIGFPVGPLGASNSDTDTQANDKSEVGWKWDVIEGLKIGICTLSESAVALSLHNFFIRRPGASAKKYQMKAYDEVILAPMCLFEPRILNFLSKRVAMAPSTNPNVSDEILERYWTDQVTQAMVISTQHLLPPEAPKDVAEVPAAEEVPAVATNGDHAVATASSESSTGPGTAEGSVNGSGQETPLAEGQVPIVSPPADVSMDVDGVAAGGDDTTSIKIDVPAEPANAGTPAPAPTQTLPPPPAPVVPTLDVAFEASKLPLDVAIFNSARAAGGDEKIKKYLQAVLVVGGTALMPGLQHALESRLQAIATPLVQNMEKVQIIPPPREIDPRVVVWKGAAVLGKMEGVSELWIGRHEWDLLGMRGLKERCFYL